MLTADNYSQQMIGQARVLDPSFSGEVGTPERKIIDTVAQSLAENQIDITGLASGLDINTKVGSNLDQFTAMFGFQRQQATQATGFVTFSRNTPAPATVTIPVGVILQASNVNIDGPINVQFTTTGSGTIVQGQETSGAVPIQAVSSGSASNVPANSLTQMVGNLVAGVTTVTNPLAVTNGSDIEDDNSYKTRFQNTWARNLAGTTSQYLAIALAAAFTTKANAIGQQSRFLEYIQVPDCDDIGLLNGIPFSLNGIFQDTYGQAGLWTTALSQIPYAKQIFLTTPTFISNDQVTPTYFYRDGTDYTFNFPAILSGDALRDSPTTTVNGTVVLPQTTLSVESTAGFPSSGTLLVPIVAAGGAVTGTLVTFADVDYDTNQFLNCSGGLGLIPVETPIYLMVVTSQPNFTFLNIFNPINDITNEGLQALNPGDVVLSEYSYVSTASRNDIDRNIDNAVDMYCDGSNDVSASTVFLPNVSNTNQIFVNNATNPWYYENFRRDGEPTKRPQIGNYITPLYQAPLDGLPPSIQIAGQNFYLGYHYWLVHEIGDLAGSIRSRDGVEWQAGLFGDTGDERPYTIAPNDPSFDPDNPALLLPYVPTLNSPPGNIFTFSVPATLTAVEVDNYLYDSNIVTLQANCEASKQITTDVLVHKASQRYFKLDVTVMYSPQSSPAVVNATISTSIQAFFTRQFFGTVIQLSSLLEIIASVPGVENVRWSNDLNPAPNQIRVIETDIDGEPLAGASVDRLVYGNSTTTEKQTLYITGSPSGVVGGDADSFTLSWNDQVNSAIFITDPIPFFDAMSGDIVTAAEIQSAIRAADGSVSPIYNALTVVRDSRSTVDVVDPILSFTITYGAHGTPVLPSAVNDVTVSNYTYNSDFFLLDDQLPSLPSLALETDTLPGLIIRVRAQNTWNRPGLG